tara:strand:- start:2780 stop:3220 length:441 start_codon:yes stop_codon:yes gene_type:complete
MFTFDHSLKLPINIKKLFEILTDFTLIKELAPDQVRECKVIQENNEETITEETLVFNTYFKKQKINQKTSHTIVPPYTIINKTIDGPFKDSILRITLEDENETTNIILNGKFKIPLKYSVLSPIIKKYYKMYSVSLFYKINNKYNI